MKTIITAGCFLMLMAACNEPAKQTNATAEKNTALKPTPTDSDTYKIEKALADSGQTHDTINARDSVTHIKLADKLIWIKGEIKPGQHPSVAFRINNKDSVVATVKPSEQNGNVRIAQIEMPDKSLDGPFGNELHYKTKGNGMYRIILSQNMMAGDPYTGGYYLSVELK